MGLKELNKQNWRLKKNLINLTISLIQLSL